MPEGGEQMGPTRKFTGTGPALRTGPECLRAEKQTGRPHAPFGPPLMSLPLYAMVGHAR